MATIVLVTGGARSGKSSYAEERAETISGNRLYVATCPRIDDEINARIAQHIAARKNKGWHTIEEEVELTRIIQENADADAILIDCLTLWINNLLYQASLQKVRPEEEQISILCRNLMKACLSHTGNIFFVTNEVGSGIVPESPESRLYRDLVGRCNQLIAAQADEVVLVSCGIPLIIKKHNHIIK